MRVLPCFVLWAGLSVCVPIVPACCQVVLQDSHSTASLRGIDSLGGGVAWASGSEGTVLRTVDDGKTWQTCAVPAGAAKLDFRGVQAFSADTAVIMASGKGEASRIYKTSDACRTWKLVFDDPEPTGFFDALRRVTSKQMYLLGDPVGGKFAMYFSSDEGSTWAIADDPGLEAEKDDGAFAASNSSLAVLVNTVLFGTGGGAAAHGYSTYAKCPEGASTKDQACPLAWRKANVPVAAGTAGAGVFSIAGRTLASQSGKLTAILVAVGGDYTRPDEAQGTAAFSKDGGATWTAATVSPRGYRSAVVYDRATQRFIAAGPNGIDVSADNGAHWAPLPGVEQQAGGTVWNAISLPFLVGSKGRIGRLVEASAH